MIDIDVPSLKEYDTDNVRRIASEIKELRTFDEIGQWDKQATEETERIRFATQAIERKIQQVSLDLEQAKKIHDGKPFLARLFSSRSEEKKLRAEQARLTGEKSQLEELNDRLQAAIDFTPDSSEDLKELLKEIRVRKKELQAEKKAVSAEMSQIRVEARQRTADSIPGKYGKWDRRRVRLAKEEALKPQENQKAVLERQIIRLDQVVAWLERFK
jgi:uncharacterized protein (DUF3084 family)